MNEKDKNNSIVNVNCDFCGKEIECPLDMLNKVEKHSCFECFTNIGSNLSKNDIGKIHIDMPQRDLSDTVAKQEVERMLIDVFPKIWAEHKEELKDMSKQELAREMFAQGAFIALASAIDTFSENEDESQDNEGSLTNN